MRNAYKIQLIITLIVMTLIVAFVSYNECHYNREGYILHTTFNNFVVFVDDCGNEWEFFTDGETFIDGQQVKVKFFDNNTHTYIKDDKIIDYEFVK